MRIADAGSCGGFGPGPLPPEAFGAFGSGMQAVRRPGPPVCAPSHAGWHDVDAVLWSPTGSLPPRYR